MSIRCIIVEDEPLALERVRGFVAKLPYLELVQGFDNAIDAATFLRSNSIDLIFLDINMDELTGIQLLESTQVHAQVIITTAYGQYALKGFELSVTDYLLKPFTFERFLQAVDKVQRPAEAAVTNRDFLFVKTENRLEKITLSEVLYIEGMRDYRRIHTVNKRIMTLQTFTEFESLVPSTVLCRVHKSYMVAIDWIDSIERNRIRIGKELIPVSETYRKAFFGLIE